MKSKINSAPAFNCPIHQPSLQSLTQAEREVLALLAAGKSVKEMALMLNKSANTVRVQKTAIYGKLQVRNQAQAAVRYFSLCQ